MWAWLIWYTLFAAFGVDVSVAVICCVLCVDMISMIMEEEGNDGRVV